MESLKRSAVAKVILKLYEKGRLYTTELSYETRITARHLSTRVLPEMVRDGIVRCQKEKNRIYYELTEKGKILALALQNPDELAALWLGETASFNKGMKFRLMKPALPVLAGTVDPKYLRKRIVVLVGLINGEEILVLDKYELGSLSDVLKSGLLVNGVVVLYFEDAKLKCKCLKVIVLYV